MKFGKMFVKGSHAHTLDSGGPPLVIVRMFQSHQNVSLLNVPEPAVYRRFQYTLAPP